MENTSKLYNHNNQVFDDLNHSEGNQLWAVEIQAKDKKNMHLVNKGINTV
jgi:hypothetical protein